MADTLKYKRIVLKLSGESLSPAGELGVDPATAKATAERLAPIAAAGVQMGIVVGAGNLVRGRHMADDAEIIHPTTADYMGMLGTVMNGIALRDSLASCGVEAVVFSAFSVPLVCDLYHRSRVIEALEAGQVAIFVGGTSHPGVTTDMCAAIRANDIDADALLKATKVDGVYSADPQIDPDAEHFESISYDDVLAKKLGIMDLPAMAFCRDRAITTLVFNMNDPAAVLSACRGETVGTVIRT
ncbi:MAG: UMP kinase [Phycisphaerales bacterium]|jgi:uridylate kinase|nr:UMP kinase [Phycisphaerales bacterium]MBT7171926.1 UMP kinase [Phycisphaerales bacterium]